MLITAIGWIVLVTVCVSPASARDPADPAASVPQTRYSGVMSGTKSYRPVEPLPWGDVNRRVAPPDAAREPAPHGKDGMPKAKQEK
jgi:hypothetical protein